jgi:4-diphosphocytidyl-2-C-methyl-D-erythritol kinase
MKERAYAKINLCLNVKGRRDDGYHELEMIMVPVDFYDVLEMRPAEETTLTNNRSYIPVNEKNTVIKAIRIMQKKYGINHEYACDLQKHIPTRAGLAGGSADAAAAIRMINKMCRLNMSLDEMIDTAREVGADVPFCILSRPAYVQGIGEKITPFVCHPDFELLLVKPRRGVSTKEAFALCDDTEPVHPDCMKMKEALMKGDYDGIISSLGNSLEAAALQLVPEIREVKEEMKEMGFDGVLMSGSGSTVFGITKSHQLVEEASESFRSRRFFVRRTRILTR